MGVRGDGNWDRRKGGKVLTICLCYMLIEVYTVVEKYPKYYPVLPITLKMHLTRSSFQELLILNVAG